MYSAGWWPHLYDPLGNTGEKIADWYAARSEAPAVEGSYGPVNATFFISSDKKGGILNPDGTINRYLTMRPRFEDEILFGDQFL